MLWVIVSVVLIGALLEISGALVPEAYVNIIACVALAAIVIRFIQGI